VHNGLTIASRRRPAAVEGAATVSPVRTTTALWVLVLFFGASLVFSALRRLTEDESTAVTLAVQVGALALIVAAVVLVVRRLR
jgi:hypothetical protein